MTGIRALPLTPYVQPTAARTDGNGVSGTATANFPTVMRDHHRKLMAPTESAQAVRPAQTPDVLLSMSRRPDIEAMIERQHAARKSSSRTKGAAVSCTEEGEDDAVTCSERGDGDSVAGRADLCGSGVAHGAPIECAPKAAVPLMAAVTSLVAWYPPPAAPTSTPTSRVLPRRRRRPHPADSHRAIQEQGDVDGDGT